MKSTSAYTPFAEDLTVYIYPNKHKDYVCVLDQVYLSFHNKYPYKFNLIKFITSRTVFKCHPHASGPKK